MKVMFLSTWFPYPPDQGSRIRALHLLKALSSTHDVSLISFADRELKPEWVEVVKQECVEVKVIECRPFHQSRWGGILGWFSIRPRAVVGVHCELFEEVVEEVAATWKPDVIVCLTFVTAPYALRVADAVRVVDVDNLLAPMLREEASSGKNALERFRRSIAYRKFERYERELYKQFDLCLVTSARDRARIREYIPLHPGQVAVVANGVDISHHAVGKDRRFPRSLVYQGALTYRPNLDAMTFFLDEVFPKVQANIPDVSITITGSTDDVDLSGLKTNSGVRFTGYVEDVRPIVAQSTVCVVPLRQGAGTRLKVLEAMALGTPVVSTSKGIEGLNMKDGREVMVADTADGFADHVIRLLHDESLRQSLADHARQRVEAEFDWDRIGEHFRLGLAAMAKQEVARAA